MKALIIGATGATGKDLLKFILDDPAYQEVVIFVRQHTGIAHSKLREVLTNFDKLEAVSADIAGDVLFSCLGTTLKAAGSKDKQRHIDLEIPLEFARIARQSGIPTIVLLSAYGASPASNVFYSRIKGELEEKIESLAFDKLIIFRPGLLLRKNSDRSGERISASLLQFLNRLGLFRKFRPLLTSILAEKLANAPKDRTKGITIVSLDEIFRV